MKRLFLLLPVAFGLTLPAQAKIWRLNNSNGGAVTPNINASFPVGTTLQQAHDNTNVLSGDTIHIEQSSTSYGSVVMTKKLVLIGPGYFLSQNAKTQVNRSYGSTVDNVDMQAGTCAGSVVTGLTVSGTLTAGASNLTIQRNYFTGGYNFTSLNIGSGNAASITGITVSQNYMVTGYYGYSIAMTPGTTGPVSDLTISNNYLSATAYSALALSSLCSGILKNNIFDGNVSVYNMYVVNNLGNSGNPYTFNNSNLEYNLGNAAAMFVTPSGANNTIGSGNGTNTNLGFAGGTSSTDSAWVLTATSPAKGTGKSGEDMGMFGGALPYVLSGLPMVPNIYMLTIAPIAAGATSISVTVGTKSN